MAHKRWPLVAVTSILLLIWLTLPALTGRNPVSLAPGEKVILPTPGECGPGSRLVGGACVSLLERPTPEAAESRSASALAFLRSAVARSTPTPTPTPTPTARPTPVTAKLDQTGYIKGFYLSYPALGSEPFREHMRELLETTELNAIVIDLKGDRGYLSYPSELEIAEDIGSNDAPVLDLEGWDELMGWFKEHNVYTIARIVTFKDELLAAAHPEWAVSDSYTGGVWRDGEGLGWADPANGWAQAYNVALAVDAAKLGFDEVQFDYVRFPSDGLISRARFAMANTEEMRVGAIAGFLAKTKEALSPYGVKLSADVFGYVCWMTDDMGIGQSIEAMAPYLDVISPMLYPSTFSEGLPGLSSTQPVIAFPYEVVNFSTQKAVERAQAVNPQLTVRPWIQDFQDYAFDQRVYTVDELRQQMHGALDAGGRGWLLWDPAVQYTTEALVSAQPHFVPNTDGRVLILAYGNIGQAGAGDQRTPEEFRADLERLLAAGYYPVNLRELVERRLQVVPAGKRPVVLTFDGATSGQFEMSADGNIDPKSAVGVLRAFHNAHPADWPLRGTFFIPTGDEASGQAPFGSADWAKRKLATLAAWGMEIGTMPPAGTELQRSGRETVQQILSNSHAGLGRWLEGYDVFSLALASGGVPAEQGLLASGEYEGTPYTFGAVTWTAGALSVSPAASEFNPYRIPRVQATQAELDRWLNAADAEGAYYVSAGE